MYLGIIEYVMVSNPIIVSGVMNFRKKKIDQYDLFVQFFLLFFISYIEK